MKTAEIKVKNLAIQCYGVFERATGIAGEKDKNKCTIAPLKFTGTDENPIVEEGTVIMSFTNINGTVFIVNQLV